MGAAEVVVPAGQVEQAAADEGPHHAKPPRLEQVHPSCRDGGVRLLCVRLDEGTRIDLSDHRPVGSFEHAAGYYS